MNFSVVCPVHNEEAMLSTTIRSNYEVGPDEVLFGVDRCTDGTEEVIRRASRAYPGVKTRVIHYGEGDGKGWGFRPAYLRRDLYGLARNDVIMNTSADLNLCPSIRSHIQLIPEPYGLISFHYYEKPWNIQCFERALITRVRPGFAGLLAFSRGAWKATEDMEDLKTIPRGEDTHLRLAIGEKYPTRHMHTRSLHLRPNETTEDHFNRGQAIYMQVHRNPVKAFVHSVFMFRPAVFAGFRYAENAAGVAVRAAMVVPMIPAIAAAMMDDSTEEIQ